MLDDEQRAAGQRQRDGEDDRAGDMLAQEPVPAANAVAQSFAIAATRPRVKRMYFYQWRTVPGDYFDAGLIRSDGTARPSHTAFVTGLAALRRSSTSSATTAAATWTARWAKTKRRTLVVRAKCRAVAAGRCRGSVRIALRTLTRAKHTSRTQRLARRTYSLRPGAGKTFTLRVSLMLAHRARAALRRSAVLTVRDRGAATRTVLLTLGKPR